MGESRRGALAAEEPQDGGPGLAYIPFVVMEDLMDKLKLLNYDHEFVRELKMMPLNRHYFVVPTNPGEQFYVFTSLAAWLVRKSGKQFDQPQEFDDPNSTISTILDHLRKVGATVDFAPSKLKQGCGEQAVFVLDRLADEALRTSKFSWKRPIPPEEKDEEIETAEDESELLLERVEEEMAAEDSGDSDDEHALHIDDIGSTFTNKHNAMETLRPEGILESRADAEAWHLELERVLPQLRISLRPDPRDWRAHRDQMLSHRSGIGDALAGARIQLERLRADTERALETIGSREKFLNAQLDSLLSEYRSLQDQLVRVREQYREASTGVTERSRTLTQVSENLDSVKQEMEERGSSMTDGTPLVNIRKAIARVKEEIIAMDVRLGVVEHTLLQGRLRDKRNMQRDVHNAVQVAI